MTFNPFKLRRQLKRAMAALEQSTRLVGESQKMIRDYQKVLDDFTNATNDKTMVLEWRNARDGNEYVN